MLPIILKRHIFSISVFIFTTFSSLGCSSLSNDELVRGWCSNPQLNDCHENADCTAVPENRTYECTCKEGFVGDGYQCDFADECADASLHTCPLNSHCVEIDEGGYRCDCDGGFERAGDICRDIDQCKDKSLYDCPEDTVCRNLEDGELYECTWMVTEQSDCDEVNSQNNADSTIQIEDDCYSIISDPSDSALYFNRCDNEDDFAFPDRGIEYAPAMTYKNEGGFTGHAFEPFRFDDGLKVYGHSRTLDDYSRATISPFTANKPDLSRGTVFFWSRVVGDQAGSVENIPVVGRIDTLHFVTGSLTFFLTDQIYVHLHGPPSDGKETIATLVVDGEALESITLEQYEGIHYYTLQWDSTVSSSENTNLKFYIDGKETTSTFVVDMDKKVDSFDPKFVLEGVTTYVGEHNMKLGNEIRAKYGRVFLDNVIIWNDIIPVGALF